MKKLITGIWLLSILLSCEPYFPLDPIPVDPAPTEVIARRTLTNATVAPGANPGDSILTLTFSEDIPDLEKKDISLTNTNQACLLSKQGAIEPVSGQTGVYTLKIGAVTMSASTITDEVTVSAGGEKADRSILNGDKKVNVDFIPVSQTNYKLFTLGEAETDGSNSTQPLKADTALTLVITAETTANLPPISNSDEILISPVVNGLTMTKGQISSTSLVPESPGSPASQTWKLEISHVSKSEKALVEVSVDGYMQANSPRVVDFHSFAIEFRNAEESVQDNTGTGTKLLLVFDKEIPGGLTKDNLKLKSLTKQVNLKDSIGNITSLGGGQYLVDITWGPPSNWTHEAEISVYVNEYTVMIPEKRQVYLSMKKVDNVITGGLNLRRVPAGKFKRDNQDSTFSELSNAYWLGETEITNKLWYEVMGYIPLSGGSVTSANENLPVNNVTWIEAIVFCNKLSVKANKIPVYSVTILKSKWIYAVPMYDKQGNLINDAWVETHFGAGKTRARLEEIVNGANRYINQGGNWIDNPGYNEWADPDYPGYSNPDYCEWTTDFFGPPFSNAAYNYETDIYGFRTSGPVHKRIDTAAAWNNFNVGTGFQSAGSDWPSNPNDWLNTWAVVGDSLPVGVPYKTYYNNTGAAHHYEIEYVHVDETANGYRLPAQHQWQWAAMGADMTPSKLNANGYNIQDKGKPFSGYNGSNDISDYAWFNQNSINQIKQVATRKPNELGIYDMTGNMAEWCYDQWSKDMRSWPVAVGDQYHHIPAIMRDDDHYFGGMLKVIQGDFFATGAVMPLAFGWRGENLIEIGYTNASQYDGAKLGLRIMRYVEGNE